MSIGIPGLKGLGDVGPTIEEFRSTLARIEAATDQAADAAVAALIGEFGEKPASDMLFKARELRLKIAEGAE